MVFRVRIWIDHEYCARAADLPGCVSQGDSMDDCCANIKDAFIGLAKSYLDEGKDIPFVDGGRRPLFHEEKLLIVPRSLICEE